MNTQLVESLVSVIRSLSSEERSLLVEELFGERTYPNKSELLILGQNGNSFDFLENEPDLYTAEDGESIA
jgi:hypothetical protein